MGSSRSQNVNLQSESNPSFAGKQQLLDSEQSLVRYTTQIVRKFYQALIEQNSAEGDILEFGAGTGFLAEIFRNIFNESPLCVEIDPMLCEIIRSKNFRCTNVIEKNKEGWKAIYTSNVLEHIERDDLILRDFFTNLNVNGKLGVYVPAFQHLYSNMDKEINHVRRYSKRDLVEKVEAAGFTVLSVHYDDFLGYFASMTVKLLGYKGKGNLGSKRSLDFYDKYVYPWSRAVDLIGGKYLLGKNIILIAQKRSQYNNIEGIA